MDFCGISVRQSVSHPPSSYVIRFYSDCAPPTISLWLLLCPWTWGILLGEVQDLPVNDCPAASCDSGALARGSESTSFYSAIVVNPSVPCFLRPGPCSRAASGDDFRGCTDPTSSGMSGHPEKAILFPRSFPCCCQEKVFLV